MLEFLGVKGSDHKRRLFAVACCRRIQSLFPDERSGNVLAFLERLGDAQADAADVWSLLGSGAEEVSRDRPSHALVMAVPAWWRITMALAEARPAVLVRLAGDLVRFAGNDEAAPQAGL